MVASISRDSCSFVSRTAPRPSLALWACHATSEAGAGVVIIHDCRTSASNEPPENPAGPFANVGGYDDEVRSLLIGEICNAPVRLREAVDGMSDEQLNKLYRNWTIRQIVHHVGDSHMQSVTRFKWALTEETPTIKAYHEGLWVELADSAKADVEPSLQLLDGLHQRWVVLLQSMSEAEFGKQFLHPESGELISLWSALAYYV